MRAARWAGGLVGFSAVSVLRRGAVAVVGAGVVVMVGVDGTSPTSAAASECFVDVGEVGMTPSASRNVAGLLPAGAETPPAVGSPS